MANVNQSTVSPKVFPLQGRKAAWHITIVKMAAWFEIIVGASFVLALNAQSQFLFGATFEGIGALFARFAGIALIGLGITSMPSNLSGVSRSAVRGLFVFNIGATIFFAWVAVATTFQGFGLCPVVMLHAIIAIALALSLRHEDF